MRPFSEMINPNLLIAFKLDGSDPTEDVKIAEIIQAIYGPNLSMAQEEIKHLEARRIISLFKHFGVSYDVEKIEQILAIHNQLDQEILQIFLGFIPVRQEQEPVMLKGSEVLKIAKKINSRKDHYYSLIVEVMGEDDFKIYEAEFAQAISPDMQLLSLSEDEFIARGGVRD